MITRQLGKSGLRVSAIGLGCMGMSEFYDPRNMDDGESIRVIHRYLDAGGNFLDTADMYGVGRNEVLVGKAIEDRRDQVVLATKFGNVRGPNGEFLGVKRRPEVRPGLLRRQPETPRCRCDRPLLPASRRPDRPHRRDGRRHGRAGQGRKGPPPGPVRGGPRNDPPRGEGSPDRRAPDGILASGAASWRTRSFPTLRELGIGFVAYSPLGRGFLTGQFKTRMTCHPTTTAATCPGFRARTFKRISIC